MSTVQPPGPPGPPSAETGGFFQELFEVARAPMALFDDEGCCCEVNDATVTFLGRPRAELVGRPVTAFVAAEVAERSARDAAAFWRDGVLAGRTKIVGPDGRVARVEFSVTANVLPGRHLLIVLVGTRNDPRSSARPTNAELSAGSIPPVTPADRAGLTRRELDVLWLLADGATNAEIAGALGLARPTVQGHVASIKYRLGAVTRAQAVAIALRDGLLQVVLPGERIYINEVIRDEQGRVVDTTIAYINQGALAREPQLAEHLSEPLSAWYPESRNEILPIIEQAVTSGEQVAFTGLQMSDAFGDGSWSIDGETIPLGRERVVVRYVFPDEAFGGPSRD